MKLIGKFCNDCDGGVITTELVLVTSVVVAGLLSGLSSFRSGVEGELMELQQKVADFDKVESSIDLPEAQVVESKAAGAEIHATDLRSFLNDQ